MGRYVPPEYEGTTSANKLAGKKALGNRANKSSQGILTVRFEMPYPIWCTSCPKPTIIGQGVRFNAEKKKVGNYYSTPIFSFRMKHTACGRWIEIRTDPKNTAYVVTEGARKRDTGEDKKVEGEIKILTEEEREALRSNAFATLEGKVEDRKRLESSKQRLEELEELQDEQWEDPYEKNKKLRRAFRAERRAREHEAGVTEALQDKMSLGLELLPENADDVQRAGFVEFGTMDPAKAIASTISKPLFTVGEASQKLNSGKSRHSKRRKAADLLAKRKVDFATEIRDNTRAATDPFLTGMRTSGMTKSTGPRILAGIKRKRSVTELENGQEMLDTADSPVSDQGATGLLVDYDSD